MALNLPTLFLSVIIGLGATLVMDIWLELRKRILKIPSLNYCFLGRWILHMPTGIFKHNNIAEAQEKRGECVTGRLAHYMIGAVLGVTLILMTSADWIRHPTIMPAVVWGVVTVFAPFFIMQPAFGFGIAASRTPNPRKARVQSLITHAIYGVGLYLTALVVGQSL